jgi:hypothetical protein
MPRKKPESRSSGSGATSSVDDPRFITVAKGQSKRNSIPAIPTAAPHWCPQARSWYNSLVLSGQSDFYEASDWATAVCAAEAYDMFFRTHNASILGSFTRLSERLGVTITDRKRSRIELDDPEPEDADEDAADKAVITWQGRLGVVRNE